MFGKLKGLFGGGKAEAEPEQGAPDGLLGGAYRPHRDEDVVRFTALAVEAFPEFADRITCFGSDWLGRQFAMDQARVVDGEPQVLMLEIGSGEAMEIPVGYVEFHEHELPNYPNEVVEYAMFKAWVAAGGAVPGYHQCVGYKQPLFLGGAHELSNLEVDDFALTWSLWASILDQVRNLPPGTPINSIKFE